MSGPLKKLASWTEHVPENDANGQPYPWARPLLAIQGLLRDLVTKVNEAPWMTGRTVSADLAAGVAQSLAHGLGRTPVRWAVEDMTGAGYGPVKRTAWDDKTITLVAYSDASVTVRVE